jgi:uncharacterized protein (TIGR02391 family)
VPNSEVLCAYERGEGSSPMSSSVQIEIPETLWKAVSRSYESENYQGAILDSIVALATAIREKTGLDADGIALVGKAFGGDSPLLRLNKLRTESEENEQRGIEAILRGVFQGLRNPRAHTQMNDDRRTCDVILAMMTWLWTVVERAGTQFTIESFLERATDKDFVESEEYADLLVQEIPGTKVFDVAVAVLDKRGSIEPDPFSLMITCLEKRLSGEQKGELIYLVSEILRKTNDDGDIRCLVTAYSGARWAMIGRAARLRIENKLIKSIGEGRCDHQGRLAGGALGTWITGISENLELRAEYRRQLVRKLQSEHYEELAYVFRWFHTDILEADNSEPEPQLVRAINAGLRRGDRRFYELVDLAIGFEVGEWTKAIKQAFDGFEEKDLSPCTDDEDIPF